MTVNICVPLGERKGGGSLKFLLFIFLEPLLHNSSALLCVHFNNKVNATQGYN